MNRFMMGRLAVVLTAVAVAGAGPSGLVEASPPDRAGGPPGALFAGAVIDLADGWGSAHACAELGDSVLTLSWSLALRSVLTPGWWQQLRVRRRFAYIARRGMAVVRSI